MKHESLIAIKKQAYLGNIPTAEIHITVTGALYDRCLSMR
jgi:hypothetical protein